MPRQPKVGRRYHSLALMDLPWDIAEALAMQMGTSRNRVIEEMFDWWLRKPGAKLPERPEPELIKRATEAWHQRQDAIRAAAYTIHCDQCGVDEGPCITGTRKLATETIHKPRLERATAMVDKAGDGDTDQPAAP